jgi:hypothetical protein
MAGVREIPEIPLNPRFRQQPSVRRGDRLVRLPGIGARRSEARPASEPARSVLSFTFIFFHIQAVVIALIADLLSPSFALFSPPLTALKGLQPISSRPPRGLLSLFSLFSRVVDANRSPGPPPYLIAPRNTQHLTPNTFRIPPQPTARHTPQRSLTAPRLSVSKFSDRGVSSSAIPAGAYALPLTSGREAGHRRRGSARS